MGELLAASEKHPEVGRPTNPLGRVFRAGPGQTHTGGASSHLHHVERLFGQPGAYTQLSWV